MRTVGAVSFLVALSVAALCLMLGPAHLTDTPQAMPQAYRRIVSLAPSYTEVVKALGLRDHLVGVTSHCRLQGVKSIGSFAEASFEAIMDLKPDLVLAVPHVMARGILKLLAEQGIAIFAAQPDSLADIKHINREVARLLGIKHRGLLLNRELDAAIYEARLFIAERLHARKDKHTLVAISHLPLVVAGPHTFPAEIIEELGLINMAVGDSPWPIWSMDALLSFAPNIFIIAEGKKEAHAYQRLFSNLGVDPARLGMRIITPEKPLFTSPSPLLIDDTRRLLALLDEAL